MYQIKENDEDVIVNLGCGFRKKIDNFYLYTRLRKPRTNE